MGHKEDDLIDHKKDDLTDFKKNVFMGLENAGKTSIVKVIQHEFHSLLNVKPTFGIERDSFRIFNTNVMLWDFGGQALYRERYLETPDIFFTDITNIIYVIDIKAARDRDIYKKDVNYFTRVSDVAIHNCPNVSIVIFFHKTDPDTNFDEISPIQESYISDLSEILGKRGKFLKFYNTSTKAPMSILNAVADIFFSSENLSEQFGVILKSFANLYTLRFSIFFTENYFQLGSYVSEKITASEIGEILELFFSRIGDYQDFKQDISIYYRDCEILSVNFNLNFERGKSTPFILLIGFTEGESILDKKDLKSILSNLSRELQKLLLSLNFEL